MHTPSPDDPGRRPIPQRTTGWARSVATGLQRAGIRPNHVSVTSVVVSALGCALLVVSGQLDGAGRIGVLVAATLTMPLRLVCNMFDGMLAVEGGLRTATGELFNEVPDRLSDLLLLAGAGYAALQPAGVTLGWLAGALAVLTAYVRTLGVSQGCAQQFGGVLPKQRRMWLLMAGVLLSVPEPLVGVPAGAVLLVTLALVALGSAVTVATRLRAVGAEMEGR